MSGDGYTDTVVCFCCHRMLNHWDLNDDPWMEHAFYSPACTFVLLTKGVRFIKDSMMKIAVAKNVVCMFIYIHIYQCIVYHKCFNDMTINIFFKFYRVYPAAYLSEHTIVFFWNLIISIYHGL